MIEQGIVAALNGSAALTALVGANIYPVELPADSTADALTFQLISGVSDYAMDGTTASEKRFQFDSWSASYLTAKQIQQAVRDLFSGFSGALPDGTYVKGVFRGIEVDLFESDSRQYRALAEYTFLVEE